MSFAVYKMVFILLGLLSVSGSPILEKLAFPYYDIIHSVAPIWLRATFNGDFHYWTKMVWWGSFVVGVGGVFDNADQGITAWQSCITNQLSPNSNCREHIKDLVKMSISNIIKGTVGWQTGYDTNELLAMSLRLKEGLAIVAGLMLTISLILIWRLHLPITLADI